MTCDRGGRGDCGEGRDSGGSSRDRHGELVAEVAAALVRVTAIDTKGHGVIMGPWCQHLTSR